MCKSKEIQSRELQRGEWNQLWSQIEKTNMLQSWEYGDAKRKSENWTPVRLLFEDQNNKPIGIAQILTKTIPLIGGIARLNRGPLILDLQDDLDSSLIKLEIMKHLKKVSKNRRWWLFYIAPEIKLDEEISKQDLINLGYSEKNSGSAWGSAMVSLLLDEDSLLASLKGKWRNLLRKSLKSDLVIRKNVKEAGEIEKLIQFYQEVQKKNKFSGVSSKLLRSLSEQDSVSWKFNYYIAEHIDTLELAGVLVCITHGETATYLIGNTTELGRKTNANYNLLWNAIIDSKENGCKWFDLGGLNTNTPKGIRHFKEGLKGEIYTLIGELKV